MCKDFRAIVSKFDLQGELVSCERYGEGHINETYLAVVDNNGVKTQYILQRINNKIFKVERVVTPLLLNKDTQVFSYVSQGSTCSNLK